MRRNAKGAPMMFECRIPVHTTLATAFLAEGSDPHFCHDHTAIYDDGARHLHIKCVGLDTWKDNECLPTEEELEEMERQELERIEMMEKKEEGGVDEASTRSCNCVP